MKVLLTFFLMFSLLLFLWVSPCFTATETQNDATELEKIVSDEEFAYDPNEAEDDGTLIKRASNRCTVTVRMSNLSTKGTSYVSSDVFAEVLKADTAVTVLALVRGTADQGTFAAPREYTPSNRPPKGQETAFMATNHPESRPNAIKFKTAYSGWKQHAISWKTKDLKTALNRFRSLEFHGHGNAEKEKTYPSSQGVDWVKSEFSPIGYAESKSGTNQGSWFPRINISGDKKGIKKKKSEEDSEDNDDSEGDDDTGSTENGGTITYACSVHSGASSDTSDHSLQASCSTDANCISTNFYLCQHDSHDYGCGHTPVHAKAGMPCGAHSDYSCQQATHRLLSCPKDQGRTCEYQTYYACSPHTHAYAGEALRPCGHPLTASGNHRVTRFSSCGHYGYVCDTSHQSTRCPPGPNGETCSVSGGSYLPCSAASHTHTYPKGSTPTQQPRDTQTPRQTQQPRESQQPTRQTPKETQTPRETQQPTVAYHPCGVHAATQHGDHTLQASCSETNSRGDRCTDTSFYQCQHASHTYPAPVSTRPCGHPTTRRGSHYWVTTCAYYNRAGDRCTNASGYYRCQPHTHEYPTRTPPPVVCPADAWTNCGGTVSHATTCPAEHSYYSCNPAAVRAHAGHKSTSTNNGNGNNNGNDNAGGDSGSENTPNAPTQTQPTTRLCGHSTAASGDHSRQASCSRDSRCTATNFYYCQHASHTYPAPPPDPDPVVCPAHSWTNCRGTVSHATTCRAEHTYYSCNAKAVRAHSGHTAPAPIRCPANSWTNCGGTSSHATTCRAGHTYYSCNRKAVKAHKWHRKAGVNCPAHAWTNCNGSSSHQTTCGRGHKYYTCNADAQRAHRWH